MSSIETKQNESRSASTAISTTPRYKRVQILIEEDKHFDFKINCMKHNVTMTELILTFIDQWLAENKKQ